MHTPDAPVAEAAAAIPILMYHNLAELPVHAFTHRGLYVTPSRFRRQMALLRHCGYRGVSMDDAMPYLRGEKQGKIAVITFDDGYRDNLLNALPILLDEGFTATCYVVSSQIGNCNDWDFHKIGVRKPMMSPNQIREWHCAGMDVGAHTRRHPSLPSLGAEALADEVAGSKDAMEQVIGGPVTQFCYPYGHFDDTVVEAVRAAGFEAATTTRRGRARVGGDLLRLPRIAISYRHMLPSFALRTLTAYEDGR